jgi:hypothetical protein
MFDDIKETPALRELRAVLRPQLGEDTDLASEGLVRYMAIVLRIFESIENDPERRAELDALTKDSSDSTMSAGRSFTNQYSEP